jgi:tetratricopeptide (TPR) repeat protein
VTGDREENLKRAIDCYEKALRVRTEHDFPNDWATIQNNLGSAYSQLPTGDRGENLKRAIDCYEAALRVHTERDFPLYWAMTRSNLGEVYADFPAGDRGENQRRAITYYEASARGYAAAGIVDEATKRKEQAIALKEQATRSA